jgi:hypothetical protein
MLLRHTSLAALPRGSAEPATRLHSKIERPIKNPNPVGLRFCYWWRRRELILDCKLLINIALMSLKIRFCYILCYIEYNFRLQKMRLIINRNVVPRGFSIESQRYNASSDA